MLLSLRLLVGAKSTEQLDDIQGALDSFISTLFIEDENINPNDENSMNSFIDKLLEKKNAFVSKFETTIKLEKKLEKLMDIEKTCKIGTRKQKSKTDPNHGQNSNGERNNHDGT